jgi:outer membrane protein
MVGAIFGTKDGQKALADLDAKYSPRSKELEKKESEIAGLRDQFQKGSNTMSEDAKTRLTRDIDQRIRAYNREREDAQTEYNQDLEKIRQELGSRIYQVIDKYARDNGYAVILDVSPQDQPVVYRSDSVDITSEIVALYDRSSPTAAKPTPGAAPAAPKPAVTTPAIPRAIPIVKPVTPPAKKQP